MLRILTDEESISHADELIERVATSIATTRRMHPDASVEALFQVLFMVNGQNWMAHSDAARARVLAKMKECVNKEMACPMVK